MINVPNPRYRLYTSPLSYYKTIAYFLLGGRTVDDDSVAKLERVLCERFNVSNAICVPQNRVGVYLTVKHVIQPGQRVIMSPYTIADIVNMVILAGGEPVFADVERLTCNVDPKQVEALLDSTENLGAVLVTHLHGLVSPVVKIRKMCEARGVPMVEDAAQAFGSRLNGFPAGAIGKAGVFSFGMFKNINTWYGGAIITSDDRLAASIKEDLEAAPYQASEFILKRMRKGLVADILTYPLVFKLFIFWIFRLGFLHNIECINKRVRTELDTSRKDKIPGHYLAKLTPLQASLALDVIDKIDADSKIRMEYAQLYHKGLSNIEGLLIPPLLDDYSHIYTYFPVQYKDRDELIKWMMKHNRDIAAQHYKNCSLLPGFSEFKGDCPNATAVAQQLIFLPTYPRYGRENVLKNVEVLRDFFAQQEK